MGDEHYQKAYPSTWRQPWSRDAKYLAMYITTCEHRTTEGLFRLPLAYAMADTDLSTVEVVEALEELEAAGFCKYDHAAKVILIYDALDDNPVRNENMAKHATKKLSLLPETPLLQEFYELAKNKSPQLAEQLPKQTRNKRETNAKQPSEQTRTLIAHSSKLTTHSSEVSTANAVETNKELEKLLDPDEKEEPTTPSDKPSAANEKREDVEQLCKQLADRIEANTDRRPKINTAWRTEMRRLIDLDKRHPDDIKQVIEWAVRDQFWSANILSAAKLRKHYDTLQIQQKNQHGLFAKTSAVSRQEAASQQIRKLRASAAEAESEVIDSTAEEVAV